MIQTLRRFFFVAVALLIPSLARSDLKVRVWPDKLACDPNEPCAIKVYVNNTDSEAKKVKLSAYVEYEVESRAALPDKELTVAGGKEEVVPLLWKPGKSVLGCGVVAQAFDGEKLIARAEEYFNVIERKDIARVGVAGQFRVSQQTEGPDAHWNEVERNKNRFFVTEALRKGYINIAEAHGLYADAFARLTPNETELAGDYFLGGFPFRISGVKHQIELLKQNGISTTAYATSYTDSADALELARQRPELVMRFERGQPSITLFDVKELENEKNFLPGTALMMPYNWFPDQTSRETLDVAIGELKKARSFWGLDGVRWDGHYSPSFYHVFSGRTFFNYKGEGVPPLKDCDRLTAANMRYVKDALRKAYPDYLFMANMMWPANIPGDQRSEEFAVMMENGGAACNEPSCASHIAGNPYNRWSEMSRLLLFESDRAREYGGYAFAYPDRPWDVSATYSQLQYSLFYATRNRPWFAAALYNHFTCGYEPQVDKKLLPYSDAIRSITRFATRYSSILFGHGMERIGDPDNFLKVSSAQPVWWKDYVHGRTVGEGERQLMVDLFNPPARELAGAMADAKDLPQAQKNIRLSPKLKPGEKILSAWFLSPEIDGMKRKLAPEDGKESGREVSVYNPMEGKTVKVASPSGGTGVVVPELKLWGIVVFNIKTR
ncbi:MAG: hypothetical protein HY360_19935 [Verrucomicrobia bacterium]|nr:hypothetical protein [Verrucomicrobiota bacterium]